MKAKSLVRWSFRRLLAPLSGVATLVLVAAFSAFAAPTVSGAPAGTATCVSPAETKIAAPFSTAYNVCDLGHFTTAPSGPHAIAFKFDDPNTVLIEGHGILYSMPVVRDAENHITGFSSPISTFATTAEEGSALVYGPGSVLFYNRWTLDEVGEFKPGSTVPDAIQGLKPLGVNTWVTGMNFVPAGFPHSGELKLISQVQGGMSNWYSAAIEPDGAGTFNITSATLVTTTLPSSMQFTYVMPGSPNFSDYHAILATEWGPSTVAAYSLDSDGNPIPASRQVFMTGLGAASGEAMDPVTGDIIFSGGGASGLVSVRGFASPPKPNNDRADLSIVQSLKAPGRPGSSNLIYNLNIKNLGPDAATGVVVTDTIPATLKLISASSSRGKGCSYDAGTRVVSCPMDQLANGETGLVSISTGFLSQAAVSNCAGIASDTPDPDPTNNGACIDYDPVGADLQLSLSGKYALGKDRTPGATFKVDVINSGPGTAFRPVVSGVLPDELDYVGVSAPSVGGKRETAKCSFASATRTVTCTFYALKAGQKAWISIVTRAHPGAQQTNFCSLASSLSPDTNPADNEACSMVFLLGANLKVTNTVSIIGGQTGKDPVRKVRYILTMSNSGPQKAENAILSGTLPAEVEPAWTLLPKTCIYDRTSRQLACRVPNLVSGGKFRLQLDTKPVSGASLVTNCAQSSSETPDPDDSDNKACSTQNLTGADLAIVNTGRQIARKNIISFALTLKNNGPDTAGGLVVSDVLPSELHFVSAGFQASGKDSNQPGKCTFHAETRTLVCEAKALGIGKNLVVNVQASYASTSGSVANCAQIDSNSNDFDKSNNESCVSVQFSNGKVTPIRRQAAMVPPALMPPLALSKDSVDAFALLLNSASLIFA